MKEDLVGKSTLAHARDAVARRIHIRKMDELEGRAHPRAIIPALAPQASNADRKSV